MNSNMKPRYRVFRRGWGVFYCEDSHTGKQTSLSTTDKAEAHRLVHAKNEVEQHPAFSLQLARVYWKAGDPGAGTRTWQFVMDEILKTRQGATQVRWQTAVRDPGFDSLRRRVILETAPEHFLSVLQTGTVSTNVYLRRLHNFALDMGWLPWPILPKKRWPALQFKAKRSITSEEHARIIAGENNPELRDYYQCLWHLGGSQTDIAQLSSEDVDLEARTISYARRKTGSRAFQNFGDTVAQIIAGRPAKGLLFPHVAPWKESDRAKAFMRRCQRVGVSGVSLHSYRYAWAERAKVAGYPERFAQEALGHNSKAVHRAYAKGAVVKVPSLEDYERQSTERKIIPFPLNQPPYSVSVASGAQPVAETPRGTPASAPLAPTSAPLSRSAG
jgi:integrase